MLKGTGEDGGLDFLGYAVGRRSSRLPLDTVLDRGILQKLR